MYMYCVVLAEVSEKVMNIVKVKFEKVHDCIRINVHVHNCYSMLQLKQIESMKKHGITCEHVAIYPRTNSLHVYMYYSIFGNGCKQLEFTKCHQNDKNKSNKKTT